MCAGTLERNGWQFVAHLVIAAKGPNGEVFPQTHRPELYTGTPVNVPCDQEGQGTEGDQGWGGCRARGGHISSPWINPREHRERRGAGLARRQSKDLSELEAQGGSDSSLASVTINRPERNPTFAVVHQNASPFEVVQPLLNGAARGLIHGTPQSPMPLPRPRTPAARDPHRPVRALRPKTGRSSQPPSQHLPPSRTPRRGVCRR